MKTEKEKAKAKAKAFAKNLVVIENSNKFSDEADIRIAEYCSYKSFIAGYSEALRWRDPKEELPSEGEEVQLKIFDSYHNQQEYTHDVYLGDRWRFCESKYIEVLGWRPIE